MCLGEKSQGERETVGTRQKRGDYNLKNGLTKSYGSPWSPTPFPREGGKRTGSLAGTSVRNLRPGLRFLQSFAVTTSTFRELKRKQTQELCPSESLASSRSPPAPHVQRRAVSTPWVRRPQGSLQAGFSPRSCCSTSGDMGGGVPLGSCSAETPCSHANLSSLSRWHGWDTGPQPAFRLLPREGRLAAAGSQRDGPASQELLRSLI